MHKLILFFIISCLFLFSFDAKAQETDVNLYLRCVNVIQSDAISSVEFMIDKNDKTFTDMFGTVKPYRVQGQFLVWEMFSEYAETKKVILMQRLNRYNLEFEYYNYVMGTGSRFQCKKIEPKM